MVHSRCWCLLLLLNLSPHYLCYIVKWNSGGQAPTGLYGQLIGFDGMDYIYLLGGVNNGGSGCGGESDQSVYRFNIHDMTFTQQPSLSGYDQYSSPCCVSTHSDHSIYYIYGSNGISEYNMDNNKQKSLSNSPIECGCLSFYNNHLYCVGGDTLNPSTDTYVLDLT
eukprot:151300_1